MAEKPDQLIKSVDRALDVLEKIVQADKPLGVTELSNSLALPKSTVYRLLATLLYRGYVDQDPLNKETIHLGIMDVGEVVYIDKVESPQTIRMYSSVGKRAPIHCTGLGKAMLAYSSPEKVDKIIAEKGLPQYTKKTITDVAEFKDHLLEVKKQGYSIDNVEHEEGIRCVAGPIFDHQGRAVASFSIAGPVMRVTMDKLPELIELVKEYTKKMSAALGYTKVY